MKSINRRPSYNYPMLMWVTVKTFNTRLDAQVAKGLLGANGILSRISSDDAGGMYPFPLQKPESYLKPLEGPRPFDIRPTFQVGFYFYWF